MSSSNIQTILHDWEEVYSVKPVNANLWTQDTPQFQTGTTYYQTYGGGPEGGYFVKDYSPATSRVFKVERNWFQPWSVEEVENAILEYEPADEMAGKTARCRLITVHTKELEKKTVMKEVIDAITTSSREQLSDANNRTETLQNKILGLAGPSAEIVRCLCDALKNPDPQYKDICLWVILGQFAVLEKELDLLKDWPHRKELLHKMDSDYGVDIRRGIYRDE